MVKIRKLGDTNVDRLYDADANARLRDIRQNANVPQTGPRQVITIATVEKWQRETEADG